jgi:glycosyltransferase involved in cell wall biosynthesis
MPKVSVVMPAYNAEKYISEAIESILNQTFTDFEFIIINDGSTDKTKEIINSYTDYRIHYLENESNLGIVATLNKGLEYASGEYIARMDADDISLSNRFEKQVSIMDTDSTIGALGTGTRIFGQNVETRETHSTLNSDKLKAELMFSTCMCHPSVMIRKSVLDENNFHYKEEFKGAEDYELWWQIATVSRILTIPDVLHCYRIHPNQITQNKDEAYRNLLLRLLDVRLNTIGLDFSDYEKECFLIYCYGDFSKYDEEKMHIYIDDLYKILAHNKMNGFFNQKSLKEVFALSVTYALQSSQMTDLTKRQCYRYAVKSNIYPEIMRLKLFVHKILGR